MQRGIWVITRIIPDERCACGGALVPPSMTTFTSKPRGSDYVCAKCGDGFVWRGTPAKLAVVRSKASRPARGR